jgi:hypothetical protein
MDINIDVNFKDEPLGQKKSLAQLNVQDFTLSGFLY